MSGVCGEKINSDGKVVVNYFWKGLALLLLGIIIGFMFAPIKKGVKIGNNNGNYNSFEGNSTEVNGNDKKKKSQQN